MSGFSMWHFLELVVGGFVRVLLFLRHLYRFMVSASEIEHLLQSCPTCEPLRKGIWPDHTPVARKLYGSLRTCDALPPSSGRLEFPSDEREEEEEASEIVLILLWGRGGGRGGGGRQGKKGAREREGERGGGRYGQRDGDRQADRGGAEG